ncbi:nucleotide modification associated domain-containing protein [Listeria booriae]|uniref:nucleotide modification associated domain-containing protein n=1 Tax=Listeria booriae TaxID=1552123 RepID=UPI0021AE2C22|nr:nucleotide modification associated domain-containing protein [Listeria booriae]
MAKTKDMSVDLAELSTVMAKAGQDAPKTFEQQLEAISAELVDLLGRKNRNYGSSFDRQMSEYGLPASLIRMDDKLSRLKALSTNEVADEVGESIDDTLLDLAGYALMTLRYLRGNDT